MLVALQESEQEKMSERLINFLWGNHNKKWCDLPARAAAGGIVVIWDSDKLEVLDSHVGSYSVSILCKTTGIPGCWAFTSVYGPVQHADKERFWEELNNVWKAWTCPWILAGDFNGVRQRSERFTGRGSRFERQKFLEFKDEHSLLEFERT